MKNLVFGAEETNAKLNRDVAILKWHIETLLSIEEKSLTICSTVCRFRPLEIIDYVEKNDRYPLMTLAASHYKELLEQHDAYVRYLAEKGYKSLANHMAALGFDGVDIEDEDLDIKTLINFFISKDFGKILEGLQVMRNDHVYDHNVSVFRSPWHYALWTGIAILGAIQLYVSYKIFFLRDYSPLPIAAALVSYGAVVWLFYSLTKERVRQPYILHLEEEDTSMARWDLLVAILRKKEKAYNRILK